MNPLKPRGHLRIARFIV